MSHDADESSTDQEENHIFVDGTCLLDWRGFVGGYAQTEGIACTRRFGLADDCHDHWSELTVASRSRY